ncbi:hypothetical protein P9222_13945 [Paenibacillus amylolyticus]|nr:hypothetical protein [Paenibacillus amylolyticus]WFR65015.1 hypothetical protein P9222_13945 [Paenibacillus amylolyticus]
MEQIKEAISNLLPQTDKMGVIQFVRQHRLESFVSTRFEGVYTKELEIDLYNIKKLNEDKLAFLNGLGHCITTYATNGDPIPSLRASRL